MSLFFWDFAKVQFANLVGAPLPRRQRVRMEGFNGYDTGDEIRLHVTSSDSLTTTSLDTRPGQFDGEKVETVGYSSPGDNGGGLFTFHLGVFSGANGYTKRNTTNGQYRIVETSAGLNARQFGVVDNVRNDAAWNAWLNIVCTDSIGKHARLTAGSYLIANTAPNITDGNVLIEEDEGASKRFDPSLFTPNVFEQVAYWAVGKSGIRIKLGNGGAVTSVILDSCTDCKVEGGSQNGRVSGGAYSGYHWPVSVQLKNCVRCHVTGGSYGNFESGVRHDGAVSTRCRDCIVSGNTFWSDGFTTRPGFDFVTGVYIFYADESVIRGNTFRNLRPSFPNGNKGSGMGYGVYEGDGACRSLIVGGNTFVLDTADAYGMNGVYVTTCKNLVLEPNTFRWNSTNANSIPIAVDLLPNDATTPGAQRINIKGGAIEMEGGTNRYAITIGTSDTSAYPAIVSVTGAQVTGARVQLTKSHVRPVQYLVDDVAVDQSPFGGIELIGDVPIDSPIITNCRVTRSGWYGILLSTCIKSQCSGNTLFDGNQKNDADESRSSGIALANFSYGGTFTDNRGGNRTGYGGHMTRGVFAGSSTQRFLYRQANNAFVGLPANIAANHGGFYTAAPLGTWDTVVGDVVMNSKAAAGDPLGWRCVQRIETTLGASLSSGATTVTLASTNFMLAGDAFQVVTSSANVESDPGNNYVHYYGSVLSITDATHLELTVAVPASYSFSNGAPVAVLRWEAF